MRRPLCCSILLLTLAMLSPAFAQDKATSKRQPATPTITVAAAGERVRFTALGEVDRLRLEVFNAAGDVVFDKGFRPGNVRDWALVDSQGQRLPDGTYTCVVTVRDLAGRLSFKQGKVLAQGPQAALALDESGQSDAVEPTATLATSPTDEQSALTAVTHNGTDGQVARTRGALTFRVGDFFSGTDREQMRLTETGDLGLGTKKPQAKLDVAGDIRASGFMRAAKGIEFTDGTVQTTGLSGRKDKDGNIVPAASGTGTQGRLAKWIDNAGTLGDSAALDTGIGLQLTVPASSSVDTNVLYTIGNDRTTGVIASSTPAFVAANGPYFALRGNSYSAIANQRGLFSISTGNVTNPVGNEGSILFFTGADQVRMTIKPDGNIGVGTTSPLRTLQLGPSPDALFTFSPSDGAPNAGYIRFGDKTGWRLHFARNRESSGGALNTGTIGELLTMQDNGNVGIGNAGPTFRLHVVDTANTGLRVQTNTSGGTVASFGGNGDFQIDAVNNVGGRLNVKENGNVGIGLPANGTPQAKLDVRGDVKLGSTGQLFAPGGEENLRIIRGFFDDGGNINAGQGFTVSTSPSLLGTYFVTFTTPFSGVPAVTVTCEDVGGGAGHACIASIFGISASGVTIDVFDDAGNSVDSQVLFIAIGPR